MAGISGPAALDEGPVRLARSQRGIEGLKSDRSLDRGGS
ncbi:MAG: hypothetical protein [Olavius algarvensis Gamma 1 endosymbiont]|nr:MAG: hypothetical protein [Olavius algarvensis Gamma 1 endosymbiont]